MHITRTVFLLLALAATLPAAAATPAERYMSLCAMCHLPGAHGAPQVGDREEWTRRLRPGLNMVYRNTIEGIPNTAMMARGGHSELSDDQVRAIVDYMIAAAALPQSVLRDAARYDRLRLSDRDFIRRDLSRDGYLSRQEVAPDPLLARNYSRFDANKDGRLSESEYRTAEAVLEKERIAVTIPDAELTATVRNVLSTIKGVDFEYVKLAVNGGALLLTGVVGHANIAVQVQDAVKRVAGVKTIDNRLVSGDQIGWD